MGSKAERIQRLLKEESSLAELLDSFRADALKGACHNLTLSAGRKAENVERLSELIVNAGEAPPIEPEPQIRPATKDDVLAVLKSISIPNRKAKDEYSAQDEIDLHLEQNFEDVVLEYNVGGYFALKIDFDIGHEKVGVEVKMADSLFKASEAQRLIGQAVYYQKKRYGKNLIVAVVGRKDDLQDAAIREVLSFLEDVGISTVRIPTI